MTAAACGLLALQIGMALGFGMTLLAIAMNEPNMPSANDSIEFALILLATCTGPFLFGAWCGLTFDRPMHGFMAIAIAFGVVANVTFARAFTEVLVEGGATAIEAVQWFGQWTAAGWLLAGLASVTLPGLAGGRWLRAWIGRRSVRWRSARLDRWRKGAVI